MFLIYAVAVLVMVASAASLAGWWGTRRDMASGQPSYLSLGDYTGIWDRAELARLFGPPDDVDRYHVPPEKAATLPRSPWLQWFDAPVLDFASLMGALAAMCLAVLSTILAALLLVVCGAYQFAGWTVTAWRVFRRETSCKE